MDRGVPGVLTNGSSKGDEASQNREVKGHLLFEIATEVANRGELLCPGDFQVWRLYNGSRRHLLSDQVQSPSYHSRIWRQVHPNRAT